MNAHQKKVNAWLEANPCIRSLESGHFFVIKKGVSVYVSALMPIDWDEVERIAEGVMARIKELHSN